MEICEITTSTTSEPLTLEVTSEQSTSIEQPEASIFTCSPADILVHRKVDLQDAEVHEEI